MVETRQIEPMRQADLDEVLAIERQAFNAATSRQQMLDELEREWAHLDVLRLAGDGGRIVGYINFWQVRDELHLLNLAVDPTARRRGHGRRLMEHLLGFARAHACRHLTLEVRRSNLPAIELYRALGFRPVGVRPRYYAADDEDAVVMLLELPDPPPPAGG